MYIKQSLYNKILENIPIVCVDVALINNKNEILLIKRKDEPAKNEWWLLGGRIKKYETIYDAVKRKTKEEVGIDCEPLEIKSISETIFKTGPSNIPIHSINICYLAKPKSYEIVLDKTSIKFKWVNKINKTYNKTLISYLKNIWEI